MHHVNDEAADKFAKENQTHEMDYKTVYVRGDEALCPICEESMELDEVEHEETRERYKGFACWNCRQFIPLEKLS